MLYQLLLASADHAHEGFWEGAWEILTDPAHWVAEFAAEILFLVVIHWWLMDKMAHRHERKHKKEQQND